jgi:quinol monooxygenase YgiN
MTPTTIIIAGWIELADEAQRDACVAASEPHQLATRADEPGCEAYVFGADPVHKNRVCIYECWTTAEALDAHFEHENYFTMRKVLTSFQRTGGDIKKFRIDAVAPVYGPGGKATATWWG